MHDLLALLLSVTLSVTAVKDACYHCMCCAGFQEYCNKEKFRATCYQPDEVVTIVHAQYGVMSRGRCVDSGTDCHADVTAQLAGECSGRRSCELDVKVDKFKADNCQQRPDSPFSLNASFSCVRGTRPLCRYDGYCCDQIRPHSIILASCKPGFRPGLQPGYRQVRAGLRHAFDQFLTFFVENLVANRSRFAGSCSC